MWYTWDWSHPIPSVPWYNGTGWTVGIKLAHVVQLGFVPSSVVHLGFVPSYPKCPMAQWDRWDKFCPIRPIPSVPWSSGMNTYGTSTICPIKCSTPGICPILSQLSHGTMGWDKWGSDNRRQSWTCMIILQTLSVEYSGLLQRCSQSL